MYRPLVFISLVFLSTAPGTALEISHIYKTYPLGDHEVVRLEAQACEIRITRCPGRAIEVEVTMECSGDYYKCKEVAKQVSLDRQSDGETLVLKLDGPAKLAEKGPRKKPGWRLAVEYRVCYPMAGGLQVHLEEGKVTVEDLRADADVWVGKGAVSIAMQDREVGSMVLKTRGGAAKVLSRNRPPMSSKRGELRWLEGDGEVRLGVQLGKGDIRVRLD